MFLTPKAKDNLVGKKFRIRVKLLSDASTSADFYVYVVNNQPKIYKTLEDQYILAGTTFGLTNLKSYFFDEDGDVLSLKINKINSTTNETESAFPDWLHVDAY